MFTLQEVGLCGVVAFERQVSIVQCLFRQHVPYLLANAVCGQLVQLERRVVFGKPTLQIVVVVLVIIQCPKYFNFEYIAMGPVRPCDVFCIVRS